MEGLTLLVENLEKSEKCEATDGRIVAAACPEVEVVLSFQEMLRRRMDSGKHGLDSPDPNSPYRPDCHLDVWIRRGSGNNQGDQGQVCIAATKASALQSQT